MLYTEVLIVILIEIGACICNFLLNQVALCIVGIGRCVRLTIDHRVNHRLNYIAVIIQRVLISCYVSLISIFICIALYNRDLVITICIVERAVINLLFHINTGAGLRQNTIRIGKGLHRYVMIPIPYCIFHSFDQITVLIIVEPPNGCIIFIGVATPHLIAVGIKIGLIGSALVRSRIPAFVALMGHVEAVGSIRNGAACIASNPVYFHISGPSCRCHAAHQRAQNQGMLQQFVLHRTISSLIIEAIK